MIPPPSFVRGLSRRLIVRGLVVLLGLAAGALALNAALPGGRRPLSFEVGGKWIGEGVAFSAYRDGQGPEGGLGSPTDDEIAADLMLAGRYWQFLNLYDSSAVTERILHVIRERKLPLKVLLGAWLTAEKTSVQHDANRGEITNLIRLANAYPEQVLAVSVGNEACVWWSDHRMTPAEVIAFIREVRAAVQQPVTTADDFDFWNKPESKAVAAEVDFINLHAYALWRGKSVAESGAWLAQTYDEASRFHAGIPFIIGETGWATQYDPTRTEPGQEGALIKGEVSEAAQLDYLRQHYRWVRAQRVPTILFEAFDENWKGGGAKASPAAAEKHWGVFDPQRRPKSSFVAIIREFYPDVP